MYDTYHTYSIFEKYIHILTYSILAYVNKQQNTFDFFFFYLTVVNSVCVNGILPEPVNTGLNIGQGSGISSRNLYAN